VSTGGRLKKEKKRKRKKEKGRAKIARTLFLGTKPISRTCARPFQSLFGGRKTHTHTSGYEQRRKEKSGEVKGLLLGSPELMRPKQKENIAN
jgi:hypothetical protein